MTEIRNWPMVEGESNYETMITTLKENIYRLEDERDSARAQLLEATETIRKSKDALEIALSIIYSWAIDGHAEWCERSAGYCKCTCGHNQANETYLNDAEKGV